MFLPPSFTKLEFTPYAWVKINCYINIIGDLEVTGLGKIEDGLITDVKLLHQRVKPAFVECNPEAIADFMREVGMREISKWKLDWHSHVNMATSPSGTDWNNYEVMSELREGQQFPVMIVNKSQSVYCGCYMGKSSTKPIEIIKPEVMSELREGQQFPVMIVNKSQSVYCGCYMGKSSDRKSVV